MVTYDQLMSMTPAGSNVQLLKVLLMNRSSCK